MNFAEEYLQNNGTEANLLNYLDKGCSYFGPFKANCVAFIASEGPALIQLLIENEPPSVICAQVKMCTSAGAVTTSTKAVGAPKAGTLCNICTFIAGAIEQYLAQNATVQEIINGLDNICNALPSSLSGICVATVQQYTPQLIQWLLNNESPQVACQQVGLCSSAVVTKAVARPQGGQLCGICELAISAVESYISTNQTEAQIIAYIENFCTLLPGSLGTYCDQFVATYLPQAIQWIDQNQPPQVFCTTIGLCSSNTVRMTPLRRVNNAKNMIKNRA
jgi:saposin